MSFEQTINEAIKQAMLAKDAARLRAFRAIKGELLLLKTAEKTTESEAITHVQLLQKLLKQREDARTVYAQNGRTDLCDKETEEIAVIQSFLPEPLCENALADLVRRCMTQHSVCSLKDMGKILPIIQKEVAGRATNQAIVAQIKRIINN